jgi:comEA protein
LWEVAAKAKAIVERSVTMKKTFAILVILVCFVSFGSPPGFSEQTAKSKSQASSELRIDLNTATREELTELPGVGDTVAARIIAYRDENGGFEKIEEIMNVRGIGEKTFLKFRDRLYVNKDSKKGGTKKK